MKEKDNLDKRISFNWKNQDKNFYTNREKKRLKEKIAKFNENSGKCKDITMKNKELKTKIYWCKVIDQPCKYTNCPKLNK